MNILKDVLILIDLEASNYYFVNKFLFTLYTPYNLLKTGLLANRDPTFTISGIRLVQFSTEINKVSWKITLNDILHTPNLHSNLILVYKLGLKDAWVSFTRDSTVAINLDNCQIMLTTYFGQLYTVDILESPLIRLTVQSK